MENAELIGGFLSGLEDPVAAGQVLVELLSSSKPKPDLANSVGLDTVVVESIKKKLPADRTSLEIACARGVGWALGRRSCKLDDLWETVASLPTGVDLPSGLRRTTGETLIGIVTSSQSRLRIAAPYIDESGLGFLVIAIVAATMRGVDVELLYSPSWDPSRSAIDFLRNAVERSGLPANLTLFRAPVDSPFAHLKVITVDQSIAYVGSANITGAGLAGRNYELGVLVHGPQVAVIDSILDVYKERAEA